jgi:uncharacterized protein YceH (UPF0502 family)
MSSSDIPADSAELVNQSHPDQFVLDPFEIRVLAVLAEKEALTPDAYPMSLNALTNGCKQLSSRDPVMAMTEDDVQGALQRLIQEKFVTEVSQAGARVQKYQHRLRMKWSLEQDKLAVLTILMLRGAQTAGEIRTRSGRLHDFSAVTDVETCLQFLMDKYPPLVAKLQRMPGTKESRYTTLLSGETPEDLQVNMQNSSTNIPMTGGRQDRVLELEEEVARLREEVEALNAQFQQFKQQFE